jgi:hypothetical protein
MVASGRSCVAFVDFRTVVTVSPFHWFQTDRGSIGGRILDSIDFARNKPDEAGAGTRRADAGLIMAASTLRVQHQPCVRLDM